MGNLLVAVALPLIKALHPSTPKGAGQFVMSIHDLVFEATVSGGTANHISDIDPDELAVDLHREGLIDQMSSFAAKATPAGDDAAKASAVEAALKKLDRAAGPARARGLIVSFYKRGNNHPTNKVIPLAEARVARASMLRDVVAHLEHFPVCEVRIDGVDLVGARTVEVHRPTGAAEGAVALLRKVELEHVGRLGAKFHPSWRPTDFEAAKLVREAAEAATGHPVTVSTPPLVIWRNNRIELTPEVTELVPELSALPANRIAPSRKAAVPVPAPALSLALSSAPAQSVPTVKRSWPAKKSTATVAERARVLDAANATACAPAPAVAVVSLVVPELSDQAKAWAAEDKARAAVLAAAADAERTADAERALAA